MHCTIFWRRTENRFHPMPDSILKFSSQLSFIQPAKKGTQNLLLTFIQVSSKASYVYAYSVLLQVACREQLRSG